MSLSILPLLFVLQQPALVPSVASPSPVLTVPASDRLRPVRWSLLGVSIAADVRTTHLALSTGRAREGNPVLRGVVSRPLAHMAVQGVMGASIGVLLDKTAKRGQRGLALGMAVGVAVVHGLAAAHNWRVYQKAVR